MGMLPEWYQKATRPQGSFGQYTQSNMFTNPMYEQQGKTQQLANMLRQMPQQRMQNPMQPNNVANPYQAGIDGQNLMLNPNNTNMSNWNSQYGGN